MERILQNERLKMWDRLSEYRAGDNGGLSQHNERNWSYFKLEQHAFTTRLSINTTSGICITDMLVSLNMFPGSCTLEGTSI
jgi:hypothetical protein